MRPQRPVQRYGFTPISPTFESGLDLAARFRLLLEAENVFVWLPTCSVHTPNG